MSTYSSEPLPHPKLQSASLPRRSPPHWHPYAPPSAPPHTSEYGFRHLLKSTSNSKVHQDGPSSHRSRKGNATACDSCRHRKLRCNAKSQDEGEACSRCLKYGTKCTFVDRGTGVKRGQLLPPASLTHGRSSRSGLNSQPQDRDSGVSIVSSSGSERRTIGSSPRFMQRIQRQGEEECRSSRSDGNWGHEQAGLVLASINLSVGTSPETKAVWDGWNIPLFLTDIRTGQRRTVTSLAVVELLIHRYYAQPSFNGIIVPNYSEIFDRLRQGTIPSHLLHTMVACAAASSLTTEPELLLWRSQAWHGASESVVLRLHTPGPPELELVQSLLLLSTNWSGGLIQVERVNTFYRAIKLALSLQLHSGEHLYTAPGPRSTRIMLFWSFYCADKILAVMTKRPPIICKEMHSMPLPSLEDIEAASGLPPNTTVAAWLQRLAFAYIALIQITECIQRQLLLPIREGKITSLDQIFRQVLPIEKKLESFCKEQRWLLGIVTELSPLCRNLAEAVISQLHFTQLHLYLPALQFEVDRRRDLNEPLHFSAQNDKPLAATIESAWHLVQQPANGTPPDLSSISQAACGGPASTSPSLQDQNASMNFSHACVLIGLNFFKFLSTNWAEWDQGNGCLRFAPIQLSKQFLQSVDPSLQSAGDLLRESDGNREKTPDKPNSQDRQDKLESALSHRQQQEGMEESKVKKRQGSIARRRELSPLRIEQPAHNLEVGINTPTPDRLSVSGDNCGTVKTPARVFFNDEKCQSPRKAQNERTEDTAFATLNSHAMLAPMRADLLQAIQVRETSQEELGHLAEVIV